MTTSPPPPSHRPQINTTAVADGDAAAATTTVPTPWSFETNWTVSRGSLDTAVTFESFDFPIDSESTAPKLPLLLVPPSSYDCEPCEIKINFTQKHEIRQVYVKSTARIYEIYYAPALHSDNEYLCTVRCSAASVDDNYYLPTDAKEAVSANLEGHNGIFPKEKVAGENNINTSEDDWVEVKLPGGRLDEGNGYLSSKASNSIRNYQDYYEATAEINDSDPCISLTLRLLSLQSKGCVYINEIYVFADAIGTNDSDNHTLNPEPSTGSTLMTMLVPTLLGLAKSRSTPLHNSKSIGKLETEPDPSTSTNSVNLSDQKDENVLDSEPKAEYDSKHRGKPNRLETESDPITSNEKLLRTEAKAELTQSVPAPENSTMRVLEELVSRVSRIEDICSRFEENVLKPITNMEARLERVEQQVELLAGNSRFLASPSSGRSEPNPGTQLSGESESEKTGSESNETHEPLEHAFVVTAPDFLSCAEKEEINDVVESPKEKPKKPVSIDDALAAALAGFSSFTTDSKRSASNCSESPKASTESSESSKVETNDVFEHAENSSSIAASGDGLMEIPVIVFRLRVDEEVISPIAGFDHPPVGKTDGRISDFDKSDTLKHFPPSDSDPKETKSMADFESLIPDVKFACFDHPPVGKTDGQISDLDKSDILKNFPAGQTDSQMSDFDKSDILKHFPANESDPKGTESTVDFESPILEVKFASSETGGLKSSPLEALLGDNSLVTNQETSAKQTIASGLLVEMSGDGVGEEVPLDLAPFESLI